MTCAVHVVWDERLTDYHFGPGHPLAPVRLELTMRLAHELGPWSQPGVTVADPVPVADAELECVLGRSASADHQRAPAPADMFPFTGLPAETGGPGAEGSVVNVTLPAGIKDARWLRAHSMRSSRRCWPSSGRRSWSASTGLKRTGLIRWPTWS